jgi:hypothetical protein
VRARFLIGTGLTAGAVVLAAGVVANRRDDFPPDAEILAEGRVIHAAECAACHGAELEGQPDWQSPLPSGRLPAPPHDATGHGCRFARNAARLLAVSRAESPRVQP